MSMEINYQKIQIVHACNDNCLFCYDKWNHMYGRASDWDFSKKDILEKIRTAYIKTAKNYMVFTGGEASMDKNIILYIEEAKKVGYEKIELITNGVRFSDARFTESVINAWLTGLNMSIHGPNWKIHDFLTRHPRAFEKILRWLVNIRKLQKNFEISVYIVINDINLNYIEETINLLRKFDIRKFDLLQLIPFGNALSNKYLFIKDKRELQARLKEIFERYKDEDIILGWSHLINPPVYEGFEDKMVDISNLRSDIDKNLWRDWKLDFVSESFARCNGWVFCDNCYLNEYCTQLEKRHEKVWESSKELIYVNELFSSGLPETFKEFHKRIQGLSFNEQIVNIPKCISWEDVSFDTFHSFAKSRWIVPDFMNYNNWFFEHGYLTKSLRCETCSENTKCKGAPVKILQKYGFSILQAIPWDANR